MAVVSAEFKTGLAPYSFGFLTDRGILSADLVTQAGPNSFDFTTERIGTASAFDFTTVPTPYSFNFSTATQLDYTDAAYSISEDCTTLTVTASGWGADTALTATAILYGSDEVITGTATNEAGTATAVFTVTQDGSYEVQLTGADGSQAIIPVLVSCRSNKCYHKMNNRQNSCCPETRLVYALLAGAVSSFATEKHERVNSVFALLNEYCTDCNAGCSC